MKYRANFTYGTDPAYKEYLITAEKYTEEEAIEEIKQMMQERNYHGVFTVTCIDTLTSYEIVNLIMPEDIIELLQDKMVDRYGSFNFMENVMSQGYSDKNEGQTQTEAMISITKTLKNNIQKMIQQFNLYPKTEVEKEVHTYLFDRNYVLYRKRDELFSC